MARFLPALLAAFSLAALLLLPPVPLRAQQDAPLPLADYQARLAAALGRLESGAPVADVRTDLRRIRRVALPDGRVLEIAPLLDENDTRARATARVQTVLGQLQRAGDDRTAERLAALERVEQRLDLGRLSLWQRFWRWFGDLLDRILPQRQAGGSTAVGDAIGALIGWGVVLVGGLLLTILLAYWLRRFLGGMLTDSLRRERAGREGVPATAAEARSQASLQAESGDYRQAVRSLFLSALLHLREADLLRYADSQTNREVLANLGPRDPVRPHLEPVVETFDRVWYGVREPDEQTFRAYSREVDALMAETGEERPGG